MRLILAILFALAPLTSWAADAIVLMADPSQTLYVRVYTSSSAATAAALTAGTSGNTRRYAITDAQLVTATLTSTPGNYPYDIFVGTPSTSADDYSIASGVLQWQGTAALDVRSTLDLIPTTAEFEARTVAAATYATSTALALVKAVTDALSPRLPGSGTIAISTDVTGALDPDDRDLEAVQHEWKLKRSGTGTYRSTNPFYIAAGNTARVGWDCSVPAILPNGTVLSTMTVPTSSDSTAGVNVDSKLGVDGRVAKVEISADADAAAASYWITCQVTNSNGGGPITIYGEVVVQAAP